MKLEITEMGAQQAQAWSIGLGIQADRGLTMTAQEFGEAIGLMIATYVENILGDGFSAEGRKQIAQLIFENAHRMYDHAIVVAAAVTKEANESRN